MASKRTIKRDVNNMVFDIVDECFMFLINDGSKTVEAEAIIDSAADFQEEILSKINAAKSKADFRLIRESLEKGAVDYINRLNALN